MRVRVYAIAGVAVVLAASLGYAYALFGGPGPR